MAEIKRNLSITWYILKDFKIFTQSQDTPKFKLNSLIFKNANENGCFNAAASGSLQHLVLTNKSLIIKFWYSISFTQISQTHTATITNSWYKLLRWGKPFS